MLIESGLWKDRIITRLCVVGIRGYYLNSRGRTGVNDRGIYDDAIFVLMPNTFTSVNGNTDPSSHRRGRAELIAPQKVIYKPGYHGYGRKSGHNAFRQAANVSVHRDGHGERVFTDSPSGRFWINLHRGGQNTTSSAGCQTVKASQWKDFYSYVKKGLREHRQTTFNYYLIENSQPA